MPGNLELGTLLKRKDVHLGLVDHYGIVVQCSPCFVAHIDKSMAGRLRVKIEPFGTFAAGRSVRAEPPPAPVSPDLMWYRVDEVARDQPSFGLLTWGRDWNCESFARFVRDGIAKSTQADGANGVLTVAAVTGGAFVVGSLIASALSSTSYDRSVRRYRDKKTGRFASR